MRQLYLKFEGLRGPSTKLRHIGDFEILFYTFSHQPMRRAGPPLAGEEMENYVEIQKWPDKPNGDLKLAWTRERVFPTCELIEEEVTDAGHLMRKVVFKMRRVVLHTMSTLQFETIGLKFESMSVVK